MPRVSVRRAPAALLGACLLGLAACATVATGRSAREAQSLTMLAHRANEEGQFDSAARYALAALRIDPHTREAELALRRAAAQNRLISAFDIGEPIRAIAYSRDGRLLLVRSPDRVRVLDAETGAKISRLEGHSAFIEHAEFSPDGARILTASMDGSARVWDVASGRQLLALANAGGDSGSSVMYARFSPDGARIVTANGRRSPRHWTGAQASVWDAESGREIARLENQGRMLIAPRFSPDGARILAAPDDWNGAAIWDAASGRRIIQFGERIELRTWAGSAPAPQFSPDGREVLTAFERNARVWRAADGALLAETSDVTDAIVDARFNAAKDGWAGLASRDWTALRWGWKWPGDTTRLRGATAPLHSISFSSDGTLALTASEDGDARLYLAHNDVIVHPSGDPIDRFDVGDGGVIAALFSPDGARIATASAGGELRLWDARDQLKPSAAGQSGNYVSVRLFSPRGDWVLGSFHGRGALMGPPGLWSLSDDREIVRFEGGGFIRTEATISADGTQLIFAEDNGLLRILDAATGEEIGRKKYTIPAEIVALSSDGARAFSTHPEFEVWDVATGRRIAEIDGMGDEDSATFALSGARILMEDAFGWPLSVLLWNADTGEEIAELKRDRFNVEAAFVTPDELRIITASQGGTGGVWDAQTGSLIAPFAGRVVENSPGHRLRSRTEGRARFSPDGARFVAAGEDGVPRIWDAFTGAELVRMNARGGVSHAAFSPDGARIVTASGSRVHLWDAATGRELASLHTRRGEIEALGFSRNGARIFIHQHRDGWLHIWDVPASVAPRAALIRHVCANVLRGSLAVLRDDELRQATMLDPRSRDVCAEQ